MKNSIREKLKLYAITDSNLAKEKGVYQQVGEAIEGGVTMVQYREKRLDGDTLKEEALRLLRLCRENDVPFIVNDNVYLAKEIGADGVHLGADDMEVSKAREILGNDAIIGATAKTIEAAKNAMTAGADYIGSGAIFGTTTKKDAKPMDMKTLKAIAESVAIPVVAIGGITGENAMKLAGTNIAGIAVVSGIFGMDDIKEATQDLLSKVERIFRV